MTKGKHSKQRSPRSTKPVGSPRLSKLQVERWGLVAIPWSSTADMSDTIDRRLRYLTTVAGGPVSVDHMVRDDDRGLLLLVSWWAWEAVEVREAHDDPALFEGVTS